MFAVHSIYEVTSKPNNVIRYSIHIALTKELYLYFHKSIKETLKISQPIVTTNRKFEFILIRFNFKKRLLKYLERVDKILEFYQFCIFKRHDVRPENRVGSVVFMALTCNHWLLTNSEVK